MAKRQGTVGERLTAARLEQGLTISEVQQMTKIQARYLEALEQDEFPNLPGIFYVRAFIRQYANVLGEDPEELVDIYDGKIDPYAPEPEQLPPTQIVEEVVRKRSEKEDNRVKSSLPLIILGIFALAILGVVLYFMFAYKGIQPLIDTDRSLKVERMLDSSNSSKNDEKSSSSSKAKENSTTSSSAKKGSKKVEISQISASGRDVALEARNIPGEVEIQIKALEGTKTWINIRDEVGKNLYVGTVSYDNPFPPLRLSKGMKQFYIIVGASNNTDLRINGTKVDMSPHLNGGVFNFNISVKYLDAANINTSTN
ncbi:MAG: helix-turn-helix domain-containing protein [Lactobacillales bacterium]|nr:helix-turn-helix domain-containing protein [Lactobacillales bacterium]